MRINQLRLPIIILFLASLFHLMFRPLSTEKHLFDYLLLLITISVTIHVGYLIGKQGSGGLFKSFFYGIFIWLASFAFSFGELLFNYWFNVNGKSQTLIYTLQGLLVSSLMFAPLVGLISMFSALIAKKMLPKEKNGVRHDKK